MTVDWVPGDWDKVKVGQQVKVVLKDSTIVGTYNYSTIGIITRTHNVLLRGMRGMSIDIGLDSSESYGDLFVEAPPRVQLPTDIGTVLWVQATDTKHWIVLTIDGWTKLHWGTHFDLTTLVKVLDVKAVPPAVTAKKVLARLGSWWEFGSAREWKDQINAIAADFGVTNV